MSAVVFLTLDEVLAIHARSIELFGGASGVRDQGLLGSALAMPEISFEGEEMHPTLDEKAAAYLFHLVKNHPFVDGNKRIGLAAALTFGVLNGLTFKASDDELATLVLSVAEGTTGKAGVREFFIEHEDIAEPG